MKRLVYRWALAFGLLFGLILMPLEGLAEKKAVWEDCEEAEIAAFYRGDFAKAITEGELPSKRQRWLASSFRI